MERLPALQFSRQLRRTQTDCERKLWSALRGRRLQGFKFRRQHPIGPFIADFCCVEEWLIIELDGGQHAEMQEYDGRRSAYLHSQGYRELRFWDNQVACDFHGVLSTIFTTLTSPHPRPLPPQAGEGE